MAGTGDSHISEDWLRELVAGLSSIERESGSRGEREAADWLVARLGEHDATARVETEALHNTFWWPLGIATGTAALAGLGRSRVTGFAAGVAGALAAATDLPPGRRRLRELLP